jgi:Flp pilus assembly protein TadG
MNSIFQRLKAFGSELRNDTSGNTMMLVALGMPMLVGGTGLAVDTAQWYLWRRELQYAVDQAAMSGAYSLSKAANIQESQHDARARAELQNNKDIVDFETDINVNVADYADQQDNSVIVEVTATRSLPFTKMLTSRGATINVSAQASFTEAATYTSCLVAVDEDDDGAITIGGTANLQMNCGLAALSTSEEAIQVNGNPDVDAGYVLAAGGIDDWFRQNTDDSVLENLSGLTDPFEELTPPDNPTAREYNCVRNRDATTITTATVKTDVVTTYTYWQGKNENSAKQIASYAGARTPNPQTAPGTPIDNQVVPNGSANGVQTPVQVGTPTMTAVGTAGSGKNAETIWERKIVTNNATYSNVLETGGVNQASLLPGTYSSIDTRCNTTLAQGIYVINGGSLTINAQHNFTGAGVMFVLKNGASIQINGGANIALTAPTVAQLSEMGISDERLAGMLVFEDRNSQGSTGNRLNGNAETILNGKIYLPKSNLTINGTASVTSQCLMLVANTLTITGTASLENLCPTDQYITDAVGTQRHRVYLVA